jgi:hypothetical protein
MIRPVVRFEAGKFGKKVLNFYEFHLNNTADTASLCNGVVLVGDSF